MPLILHAIWGDIWKRTVEKSQTNATNEETSENTQWKTSKNKCSQCDYASSLAGDLRRHIKMHSGEKSNNCNHSDYASSRAGDVRRHLKTHTGEKSNKCNQCDYASFQAGDLRKRFKIHNGEKSNKCNECGSHTPVVFDWCLVHAAGAHAAQVHFLSSATWMLCLHSKTTGSISCDSRLSLTFYFLFPVQQWEHCQLFWARCFFS